MSPSPSGTVIGRLLELFEGQEAPGPWSPPAMPAALHTLLPWRAFDEASELYVNAASTGFVIELPPFAGIDGETLGALAGTLADAAPERCTIQVIHWTSPRFGAASRAWAEPRRDAGGALARMGAKRRELLAPGGWRRLHRGGPPFTLSDYRVFVTACLAGGPGPAAETALGAFRGRSKARSPRRAPARGGWSRTGSCRWRRNSPRPTSPDIATGRPNARPGAGRRAIRCTSSAPPRDAR